MTIFPRPDSSPSPAKRFLSWSILTFTWSELATIVLLSDANCCVMTAAVPATAAKATATTISTDAVRPSRRRSRIVTSGLSTKAKNTAIASGMNTVCAQ